MEIEAVPVTVMVLEIVLFPFLLAYLLSLLLRFCFGIVKQPCAGWGARYLAAFSQSLVGMAVMFGLRAIGSGPFWGIGLALVAIILSGIYFYKLFFKLPWADAMKLWRTAAIFQVFLLPLFTALLVFGLLSVLYMIFPPQF